MNFMLRAICFVLLILVAVTALIVRFSSLDDMPGLEHDEALICLGAQNIYANQHLPLTGDKVYEGPLLEYLLSSAMVLSGNTIYTARFVMAFIGLLAVFTMYWAGKHICSTPTGIFSAMLILLSPWHLTSSRVIYACNMTQLFVPIWMASTALYVKTRKKTFLVLSGLAIGLAANGRFTAYILAVVSLAIVLIHAKNKKTYTCMMFLTAAIIPGLPVFIYNIYHSWPALKILTGEGQLHLFTDLSDAGKRIIGYAITLANVLTGKDFWLDVVFQPTAPMFVLPLFIISGLYLALGNKSLPALKWMACAFLILMITVPVVVKTVPEDNYAFHPHYLDMSMPFAVLFSAVTLGFIEKHKTGLGYLLCLMLVIWQGVIVFGQLLPELKTAGLPGRWSGRATEKAACIENNFDPQKTTVIVPWHFGMGYPQLKLLLPDYSVIPVIHPCYGIYDDNNDLISTQIIYVSPVQPLVSPPWRKVDCNTTQLSNAYFIKSPGFNIHGEFSSNKKKQFQIKTIMNQENKQTWPNLKITSGSNNWAVQIYERTDHFRPHPVFVESNVHVAPRHAEIMDSFRNFVYSHTLIGSDADGNIWTIQLSATPAQYTKIPGRIQKNGVIFDGTWIGQNVFY